MIRRLIIILLIVKLVFAQGGPKLGVGLSLGTTSGIEAQIGDKWGVYLSIGYYGLLGKKKSFQDYDFELGKLRRKYKFDIGVNVLSYVLKNFHIKEKYTLGVGIGFGYRQFWGYKHSYPDLDVEYVHRSEKVIGFYLVPLRFGYKYQSYIFWFESGVYLPSIYEAYIVSFSPLANVDNNNEFMIRVGVFRNINLGKEK